MSIIIPPNHPSDILRQPQKPVTFVDKLAETMTRENLLQGKGRVGSQTRTPNHPLVTPESEEWKPLQKAAEIAYDNARDFLGLEFCDTLCEWLGNVKEIYLYKPARTHRTRTGLTIIGRYHPPVLHIVLNRDTNHPDSDLENARTLKHEMIHCREYVHPIRLTRLERQIKAQFRKNHGRGLTDQTTRYAISQEGREQLPWAMEALTLGVGQTMPKDWRKPRPALVQLIQQYKPQIAGWEPPTQLRARKLTVNHTQQESNMTTQPTTIPTNTYPVIDTEEGYRNECVRTQQGDKIVITCYRTSTAGGYPTHPLSRGVLRWLKEQAKKSLDSAICQWDGCYPEYQQLRNGTHPDPNPGQIITPDNPDSFKPEQIDVSHELPLIDMETDPILSKTLLSTEDYPLYMIEPTVARIDRSAWFTIETIREQQATRELYAQACIEELEDELKRHEYGRRIKEDLEYARQVEKLRRN